MKAIIIEGVLKFQNSFKEFNGTVGLEYATDQQWYDWGFRELAYPTLTEYQTTGEPYLDTVNDVITYAIVDLPHPTAQELYDRLIEQGKHTFDEFRRNLSEAASPYNILGNHPQALKDLTIALLDAKARILTELDLHLVNNDVTKLKAFTYETPEAEMLRQAIENFK